jgi:mono/diheme cytochrome c family protein
VRRGRQRHASSTAAGSAALLLLAVACGPAKKPESPAEIYAVYCARCHAADGRGVAQQLERYPKADLTRSEMLARGDRPAVLARTAKGYGPMPAFADKLTPAELEKVTDFVLAYGTGPRRGN